jgi:predicted phage-related endonuclease
MGSLPSGLSGSRAAAIIGLSRYRTPVAAWLDIMEERFPATATEPGFCAAHGFEREEFDGNASTRWGLAFEAAIIQLAEIARGDRIIDCERLFTRAVQLDTPPTSAFVPLTCHLDGVYSDAQVIHEGKTTTSYSFRDSWGEPGSNRIPQEYQVQVQHQMLVSGLKSAVVSVLVFPTRPDEWEAAGITVDPETHYIANADGEMLDSCTGWARTLRAMGFFHQYEIALEPHVHEALLDTYADFWRVNVLGETPPTATRFDDCKRLFTAPKGTIVADERLEREISEYRQINDELGAMSTRKDQIRTSIVGKMAARAAADGLKIDDDSTEKWVLRGASGKKLAQYGRSKRGGMEFR